MSQVHDNPASPPQQATTIHDLEDATQTPGAGPSRSPASSPSSTSLTESSNGKAAASEGQLAGERLAAVTLKHTLGGAYDDERSAHGNEMSEDDDQEEEPLIHEPPLRTLKYSRLKGHTSEILAKDTISAIEMGHAIIVIGTHNGMVHVLSYEGSKVHSFRPHAASVISLCLDEEDDHIATASVEGRVVIHSLITGESHAFDYKRPMCALALEPGFGKKASKGFVCGGMGGNLILQEKGWLGYKEQILHSGEGPIWVVEWCNTLIAWANDLGVKIYDTSSNQRIGYVDRGAEAPRAELFKCSLLWKDNSTLVIAWADFIKVVRIRSRSRSQINTGLPALSVEMTGIYQVDCMVAGIAVYQSHFAVLAYIPPDSYQNEATDDPQEQRRKAANRPELRLIDKGEELSADALSLSNFHMYSCNDYLFVKSRRSDEAAYFVVSPADVIIARPRDEADHIAWLVDQERFEEALEAVEVLKSLPDGALGVQDVGRKYMSHLMSQREYMRAAGLAPKALGYDLAAWTHYVERFIDENHLNDILHSIPIGKPQLPEQVYGMVLDSLLSDDKQVFLATIKLWPVDIYDFGRLSGAVQDELEDNQGDAVLLECMGELYLKNGQPSKALAYFLDLHQSRVFVIIREYSLYTIVQDRVLRLLECDPDAGRDVSIDSSAIKLLADHIHSIPVDRVVPQLETRPQSLFRYFQRLFNQDPQLCFAYSDHMIELAAKYGPELLMLLLRKSNQYDLEKAYAICKDHDRVLEMVFLLGRMGNNREALMIIIERLGDVGRAIEFAREQADEELWEDLLAYSETRPDFVRALLENVGTDISPIRLIRRIKNGMEIPGLKNALIKIVQTSNLQASLSEGCSRILSGDCSILIGRLINGQGGGAHASEKSQCVVCGLAAFQSRPSTPSTLVLMYLCRHFVHASCSLYEDDLEVPQRADNPFVSQLLTGDKIQARLRELSGKLSFAAAVRTRVGSCPVCFHARGSLVVDARG